MDNEDIADNEYLMKILESQKEFEKEPCSKIMEKYECKNCKAISENLPVYKVILDEVTYKKYMNYKTL